MNVRTKSRALGSNKALERVPPQRGRSAHINKVLVILPHNPGDVIMGACVLSRLRCKYPHALIDWVVSAECSELVLGNRELNKVHIIPAGAIKTSFNKGDMVSMLRAARGFFSSLESAGYDLSINLFQEKFGALLHTLAAAPVQLGYTFENNLNYRVRGRYMQHLFSLPVARGQNPWHVCDIYARALGVTGPHTPRASLPPIPAFNVPWGTGPRAVFQLGSAWPGKRWPVAHWAGLARILLAKGYTIALTGASEEAGLYKEFATELGPASQGGVINLMGLTSLMQSVAAISQADILITGDTVAMHMGAAVDTRTVALFGASNPVETGPYGPGHFVLQKSVERPERLELNTPCADLDSIKPRDVGGLITDGLIPAGLLVWETVWDSHTHMLKLVDYRRHPHPFHNNSGVLELALQLKAADSGLSIDNIFINQLIEVLKGCIQTPLPGNLAQLEALEQEFAEKKYVSIIWEAYRIAINGYDIRDLKTYLVRRLGRLRQAAFEEQALNK